VAGVVRPGAAAQRAFDELAAELGRSAPVEVRRLFGREGLRAGGRYFAFLDGDRLVVHVPPAQAAALLASGRGETGSSLSPSMRKWLAVPFSPEPEGRVGWSRLLDDALVWAASRKKQRAEAPADRS
jgi:hypothetical protein